jgi:hypothetical protein
VKNGSRFLLTIACIITAVAGPFERKKAFHPERSRALPTPESTSRLLVAVVSAGRCPGA